MEYAKGPQLRAGHGVSEVSKEDAGAYVFNKKGLSYKLFEDDRSMSVFDGFTLGNATFGAIAVENKTLSYLGVNKSGNSLLKLEGIRKLSVTAVELRNDNGSTVGWGMTSGGKFSNKGKKPEAEIGNSVWSEFKNQYSSGIKTESFLGYKNGTPMLRVGVNVQTSSTEWDFKASIGRKPDFQFQTKIKPDILDDLE